MSSHEVQDQTRRSRLFGRAGHLDHPEMAADRLWRRGRHLHRRPRPGRGAGAGAQEGASCSASSPSTSSSRTCARNSSATTCSRCSAPTPSTRASTCSAPRSRGPYRQASGRDRRARSAPTRSPTAQPAKATTRCASSSRPTRSSPTSRSSRRGASGASPRARRCSTFAEQHQIPIAKDKRGEAPFSVDANLLHVSSEGKVLEDPAEETPALRLFAHGRSGSCAGQADRGRDRVREGRSGRDRRQADEPGDAARRAEHARPRQRHRPARPGREPLRRHEVARHVRDAGGHDPARGAPRHRIDHPRPRRGPPQGRADAQIRGAHLQRLLVLARARAPAGR